MKENAKTAGLALALVASLTLIACGSKADKSSLTVNTPTPTRTIITGPAVAPEVNETIPGATDPGKPTLNKDVSIAFVGDIICDNEFKENYDRAKGLSGVASEKVLKTMQDADLLVANHEYCSTDIDESNKLTYQTWIEKVPSANEKMFAELGVDVCSLANNHAFDYGPQGFLDTLSNLKAVDIDVTGAGYDAEGATDPVVKNVGGKTVAIFASSLVLTDTALIEWTARENTPGMCVLYDWFDNYSMLESKIKAAKAKYDFVVLLAHWGEEKSNRHNQIQQYYAHKLIDTGVDVVIGDHAHVLQGIEYYNDGICFYGMSNFIFSNYQADTMVLSMNIDVDKNVSFNILPCTSANYYTRETDSSIVFDTINENSVNAKVLPDGTVTRTE